MSLSLSSAAPTSSWPNLPDISGSWHQPAVEGTPYHTESPKQPASTPTNGRCVQERGAAQTFEPHQKELKYMKRKGREVELFSGQMPDDISLIAFGYVAMSAFSTPLIRQEKNQAEDHPNFSPASWVNITQDQLLDLNALSQYLR